jgi:hypothetical protein
LQLLGGVSNLEALHAVVAPVLARHVYRQEIETPLRRAAHRDASRRRGSAMLWDSVCFGVKPDARRARPRNVAKRNGGDIIC